jgi:Rad3-related DNA helicase/DNA polymerase III epsilon subunit-like protein
LRAEYVSVDLELAESAGAPQIIEIGAVRFDSAGQAERWSTLVRPTTGLTYRIEQLTGLSTADLATAPPVARALGELARFAGELPLVGQSIDLDLAYLERAGLRLTAPAYDTFELAQLLLPGLPTYDLRAIARALGVAPRPQHRALSDAETAMDVFLGLVERIRALRLETLMLVNRLAAGLHWPPEPLFAEAERAATRRYLESVLQSGGSARLPDPEGLSTPTATAVAPPPLAPDSTARGLDGDALEAALSSGGLVASRLAGYEERREQLTMLRAVSDAFRDAEHLVTEAGTGTGKSMAYLVPAVGFAAASGRRVVVSTNTINLQDQLVQKDLPALSAALPFPVRTALVKGRGNYLCLRRWQAFLRSERMTAAEAMLGIKVAIWLEHTHTGDRAELRLPPEEAAAWSKLSAHAEHCTPGRCPFHRAGTCFLARARLAAESAHVVVVNHALLLSDVATGSKVLPEYRYLVVDEAHHLEAEATEQLGVRLTERDLSQALDHLQVQSGSYSFGVLSEVAALAQRVSASAARVGAVVDRAARAEAALARTRAAVQDLFGEIHAFVGARTERAGQDNLSLRITPAVRASRDWQLLERGWSTLQERWLALARPVAELHGDLEALAPGASAESGSDRPEEEGVGGGRRAAGPDAAATAEELSAELEVFLRFSEAAQEALDRILASPSKDEVYWLDLRSGGEITLHAAPLHVGARLWDDLFSRKDAAILTSATLTTEGSFRYLRDRLGLREARELQVGSPFNYHDSTLVYVPVDIPEPGQAYHQHRLVDTLVELIGTLGGRTLVLFTSHGQLRQTHEALRAPLEAQRVVLLGQNIDGSRARLLETFRAGPRAVLLGTTSFWEGVDVPGEALSCLVIARLPFAVPTEPVFAARSELFDDPFREYAVPQAILRFKQGFGRLIRSRSDRGVVAVLDRRLVSKSYGRAFLGSLPDCVVRTGPARDLPATAASWLER